MEKSRVRQTRRTKRSLRRDNPFCPKCLKPTLDSAAVCGSCNKNQPTGGWPSDNYTGRTIIDKYWVLDRIGASEDSILLRAYQVQAGYDLGDVVLRILQPLFAANRAYCQRFADEAKAARRLNSPYLVKVFDFDFDELGIPFVVMEKPEGPTLREVIERSVVSAPRTVRIALQLIEALRDRAFRSATFEHATSRSTRTGQSSCHTLQ